MLQDDPIFFVGLPPNIFEFGKHIEVSKIPESIQIGSTFPLFISEINSPFKFWFHLKHNKSNQLDIMMNNIE